MATKADLLIHSAAQLCVVPAHEGGPQRGARLGDLGLLSDGAIACADGVVAAVGTTDQIRADWWAPVEIDGSDRVVCPGFVDPHTHAVFAGDRAAEFEQRVQGATYLEIQASGGGIMSTVRATRGASVSQLVNESRPRLDRMLAHGTTTAEVKTGYGLNTSGELAMLQAIHALDLAHPMTLVPTFLGAHAVPEEFGDDPEGYVDLVVDEMIPLAAGAESSWSGSPARYCDVFCEEGAFSLEQSRRVLERAKEMGLGIKIHSDEFNALGGTAMAVDLGATSADHLVSTPPEEIQKLAQSDTVAVALPATPFGLGHQDYTPAKPILEAGGILALATDLNPGTAWCESMPFVIALACRYMGLSPAQALVAATLNAAHAVGLGDRVGSLEVGRVADILLIDLPDVRHLGYRFGVNPVGLVVKSGKVVSE